MRARLIVLAVLAVASTGCSLETTLTGQGELTVRSPTIQDREPLPAQHSCEGAGTSPPLSISELPQGTETVAVIVDDQSTSDRLPDAHWLVWNAPASGGTASFPEDSVPDPAREGTTVDGTVGYQPPCPPRQDDAHTYRIAFYAVDRSLELSEGAERAALVDALEGHVLATGRLTATYDR